MNKALAISPLSPMARQPASATSYQCAAVGSIGLPVGDPAECLGESRRRGRFEIPAMGRHRIEPSPGLLEIASLLPEPPQPVRQVRRDLRSWLRGRPVERGAQIVVVGSRRSSQIRCSAPDSSGAASSARAIIASAWRDRDGQRLPARVQHLRGVLPDRLEHARSAARRHRRPRGRDSGRPARRSGR